MKNKLLLITFFGTLFSIVVLQLIDIKLQNGNIDFGIVSFELAGNIETSQLIISDWKSRNLMSLAIFSLGFDYLFLFFYVSFLSLWTSVISESFYKNLSKNIAGIIISFFVVAGILDMIENYALLQLIENAQGYNWVSISFYCASVKFSLIALGIIYNLVHFIKQLISRF